MVHAPNGHTRYFDIVTESLQEDTHIYKYNKFPSKLDAWFTKIFGEFLLNVNLPSSLAVIFKLLEITLPSHNTSQ